MFKVLIRDNMSPIAKEILEASNTIQVVIDNDKSNNDPKNLLKIIGDYHGLAIRSGTRVTEEVIHAASHLRVIGRAGVGVDNIDVLAATPKGIAVMNAPGGNTITTAEHTISMMLALARNIPQATASMKNGQWEKKKFKGVEISGKILGIVGLGHIGRMVASLAKGLNMQIMATDPFVSKDAADTLGVELVSFDTLIESADFISLHVPRLKETINMINADTIKKMKPGVRLINCSRGEIIQLEDLLAALENGHVAGAALDVFPVEPPDPNLALLKHPRVILTPHLGASTEEAQTKVAEMIARQMAAYLNEGIIQNAVNVPSVSKALMDKIHPYFQLAEKMGALMGQLVRKIHDVSIQYSGGITDFDTRPLTNAVLKGLLSAYSDTPVNYVSAPAIAQTKGIHVKETSSKGKKDFNNLIRIALEGVEDGPNEIWGTVFGGEYPRIVRLGKIYMDAIPEGSMIIIQNLDKPGVIGNVGSVLGKHQINIGRYQLGRLQNHALCMVNVDSPADETVLAQIKELPNIVSVHQVHLS